MPDVAQRIRARLTGEYSNDACLGGCGTGGCRCSVYGFDEMRDALLAAVAAHKPHTDDPAACGCIDYDDVYVANVYPCRTLVAIAKAPGIEVG